MPNLPPLKRGAIEGFDQDSKKQRTGTGALEIPRDANHFENLPDHLVSQIFSHLLPESSELSEERSLENGVGDQEWADLVECRTALYALSVTSRAFGHLSLAFLYRVIIITKSKSLVKLLQSLVQYPERGQHVRQLIYTLPTIDDSNVEGESSELFAQSHISSAPEEYKGPLACLRDRSHQLFTRSTWSGAGAVLLPILTLTPRITMVDICGPREWLTQKYTAIIKDPLFRLVSGIDTSYSDSFSQLFPRSQFGLHLGDPGTRPAFPPPFLETMTIFTFDKEANNSPMFNRVAVLPPRDIHELLEVTLQMETELVIGRDDEGWIVPSFVAPSAIAKATPELFMSIRKYLERIRPLNVNQQKSKATWTGTIDRLLQCLNNGNERRHGILDWDKLDDLTRPFRESLGKSLVQAQTEIVAQFRQDIASPLVEFIELGHRERPRVEPCVDTKALTLTHPRSLYIKRDQAFTPDEENLSLCITSRFEFLTDLDMVLRLHKDNRRDIYEGFSPAGCFNLRNLAITAEGLWGPIDAVFRMLENDEGTDGVNDTEREWWAEKRKAVERIPPALETLRIIDWFAEYCPELAKDHVAVAADRIEWEDDDLNVDGGPNRGSDATPFYTYPTIRGDRNPFAVYSPSALPHYASRYIDGLAEGLTCLCVTQPPTQNHHYPLAKPLLSQMRPSLRTIEFVYTLQSELPCLEHGLDADSADNKWRLWYHTGGYRELRGLIKEHSGIDLVIWEGNVGVVPQLPV